MADKDPIVPKWRSKGELNVVRTPGVAPMGEPAPGSKYGGLHQYSDPFSTSGWSQGNERGQQVEAAADSHQSRTDKFFNGLAKFGGSFSESMISSVGTIWGLAASPFAGGDYIWNNEINRLGASINEYTQENFRNYKSMTEQNASGWSPSYWMTMNFLADGLLANAGFTAGAMVTGMGMSKLLTKLAPLVARGSLAEGLNIARTQGITALDKFAEAHSAVRGFDRLQAGASALFSAMGEGSVEAIQAYKEFKQQKIADLAQRYGGEDKIAAHELDQIEWDAREMGNTVFALNIPVLTASNMWQFGKSMLGYKSLTNQAAKAQTRLAMTSTFGEYAEQAAESGFKNGLLRTLKGTGKALANNFKESLEEGAQFLVGKGSQNYYSRKFDQFAADTWDNVAQGYMDAATDLVTTQEGVTNLLAGFGNPGSFVSSYKNIREAITNGTNKAMTDYQLQSLNRLDVKDTIKRQMESAVRGASLSADLDAAIQRGDEFEARNTEHDLMKNYVQSRIEAGRYDLLETEIDRMMKMSADEFKQYFDIETEADFDHTALLKKYKETARDMQQTWVMLERLFTPALYRFREDETDENKKKAIEQLHYYRETAWSYLMDAKDSDRRLETLRKEVDTAFGGFVSMNDILGEKSKDRKLNNLIKEYNTLAVEREVRRSLDPEYTNKEEYQELQKVLGRLKYRINQHVQKNRDGLGLPDYIAAGQPEFLEQYLFEIEQQLNNLKGDAIFRKALLGDGGAMVDVRQAITKLNDLRKLERRRMLAVEAYNNYSSMVREGKYRDLLVKNPAYDPEDESKGPEYVTNEELLRSDAYQQFKDERDDYRAQRERKQAANAAAQADFDADLQRLLNPKARHEKRDEFKAAYNRYYYGDDTTQGYSQMTDRELSRRGKDVLQESINRSGISGRFRTDTAEAREAFDYAGWIEEQAKIKAFNDAVAQRRKDAEKAARKEGRRLGRQYEKLFYAQGEDVAEALYGQVLQYWQQHDPEAAPFVQEEMDKTRTALEVLSSPAPRTELPTETGTETEAQAPEVPVDVADLTPKKETETPAAKQYPEGVEPNNTKGGTSPEDDKTLEAHLKSLDQPSQTYLTLRRSDLKSEEVEQVYAIKTLDSVKAGTRLMVSGKEMVVTEVTDDEVKGMAGERPVSYRSVRLLEIAREGKLQKAITYRDNVYDDEGRVVVNQFVGNLYDPKSKTYLRPGTKIKWQKEGKPRDGKIGVALYILPHGSQEWQKTNIYNYLDPAKVRSQFPKNSKVSDATVAAIEHQVEQMIKELHTKPYVLGEITDDPVGFGRLIFNREVEGMRERLPLGRAFGLEFLNNRKVTGGAFLGVLENDNETGNVIRIRSAKNGNFIALNGYHDIYIPQSSVDALTKGKKKAGQAVVVLPTGKIDPSVGRQVYIPVLLNTRDMLRDTSVKHARGDNKAMTAGELLVDVLLNPMKKEYRPSLSALYESVMGVPFDEATADWKNFYTNENLFTLMNKVFFAGAQQRGAGVNENTVKYTYPFAFYVREDEKGRLKATIDISRTAGKIGRTQKKVVIYLQDTEGGMNTSPVEERIASYLQAVPAEDADSTDTGITYQEILDMVRQKPYRVDMDLAARSVEESDPFDAIVLNEAGDLAVQTYESYLHYVDDKQLLETTVQGLRDGGRQFYFVNPVIPYRINIGQSEQTEPKPEAVKQQADEAKAKETVPLSPDEQNGWDSFSKVQADPKGNIVSDARIDAQPETPKPVSKLKSFIGTMKKKPGGPAGQALIDFNQVHTVEQFSFRGFEPVVPMIAEQVNQELIDMLVEEYTSAEKSATYNKKKLKTKLIARLQKRVKEYQRQWQDAKSDDEQIIYEDRLEALEFALEHFDMADFDKLGAWGDYSAEEHRSMVSYGRDEAGRPIYFVGFFNLALNELFKSKIVDVSARGKELLDFEGKEEISYTARFDDGWSFKVDPRNTIGKFARILMSRVPQYVYNDKGTLVEDRGPLGLVRYMPYESVHKALIAQAIELPESDVFAFVESIPEAHPTNAALMGIHKLLMELRGREELGEDLYQQAVSQLFNATLLQQADYLIIETETSRNKNATQKIYNASRQMINDEIVSRWSKGLRERIQQGRFVTPRTVFVEGVAVTRYEPKLEEVEGVKMTLSDMLRHKVRQAFQKKADEKFTTLADIYVNDLGFPLSGDGTVGGTANVLQSWAKLNKKKEPVVKRLFKIYDYQTLEQAIENSLVELIAIPLEEQLSTTGGMSSFNPEEPLKASTTILNAYAKALKGHFQDVVNATITDINNHNRYIYVARNNLSQLMLQVQDINYLWEVANSTYGKYMPGVSDVFNRNDRGEFIGKDSVDSEALARLQAIRMDYAGGIKKDKYRVSDSKTAKRAAWNLLGLNLYQNNEEMKTNRRNGVGRFLQVFGDTSTAIYYEDVKELFGIDMSLEKDGSVKLSLSEVGKHGTVLEQLYGVFKAEVNRSVEAVRKFQQYNTPGNARALSRNLRYGYHYNIKKGVAYMGSAAGVYNFDEAFFNEMMDPETSPLFVLDNVSQTQKPDYRVVGIRPDVLETDGRLNDAYLRQVFEQRRDAFITRMVDAKMKQLEPFMKDLLEIKTNETREGIEVSGFKMPLFANTYVQTFMKKIVGDTVKSKHFNVTEGGKSTKLMTLYRDETNDQEGREKRRFATHGAVLKHSYPALLLRAMVADQQVNHFLFKSKWTAWNGVDPALYQKEGKSDYRSFFDNYNKRMKGLVTPKLTTVQKAGDKVRMFTFKDPKVGDFTLKLTADQVGKKLNTAQQAMLAYLEGNAVGGTYLAQKDDKGTYTLPARIFGHQGEVLFNLYRHLWDKKQGATDKTKARFNQILATYLDGKITDGNTYVTLREYLYRQVREGRIGPKVEMVDGKRVVKTTEEVFNELYDFFHKNPKLSLSAKDFREKLPLVGLKYVASGVKVEGGEMLRVYGKNGEFVLFPALTAGTEWDEIRKDLESHELKGMNAGVILQPASSMKLGGHDILELFGKDGKYTGSLKGAVLDEWDRTVLGKQIQNPDKLLNEVTGASQANTNIHNNIAAGTVFGADIFVRTYEKGADDSPMIWEEATTATDAQWIALQQIARERKLKVGGKQTWERRGVFNREIMRMKFRAQNELMRRDLEKLMGDWGLKYERGGEDYQRLLRDLGLPTSASAKDLVKLMNGDNPQVQQMAYAAYKIRNRVVMDNIDRFLNDVKAQLMQRKGLTPNNTYLMRKVKDLTDTMEIPATFNPHSPQIQSVILSRINAVIQGRKLPGFSFVQMSSLGFNRKQIAGAHDLKGYTARYDESGKFAGVNPAEIALPWRFTNPATGELLDYDEYVNEDGTPKEGKWDPALLDIIGLRIPNTGPNTMGYFRVVRFLRGYKDVAQVPMEIVAQMNSDFDFDKLVSYIHNYELGMNGQLTKVKGYLDPSQVGVTDLLDSPEARQRAIRYKLSLQDSQYAMKQRRLDHIIDSMIREYADELLAEKNELLSEDEEAYSVEDLLNQDREGKMETLIRKVGFDSYTELTNMWAELEDMEQAEAESFDMDQFIAENPDALQILQSSKALENAIIDTYHIMLREESVARQMLMPLTTDWVREQVDEVKYGEKSLREQQLDSIYLSPTAEVAMSEVRTSSTGADVLIGIFANFQKFQHIAQLADLAVSDKADPIFFGRVTGKGEVEVIGEEDYDPAVFAVSKKQFQGMSEKGTMTYNGKVIPFRLGRLMGRDEHGNHVPIAEVGAATLQAALDNLNDPLLGVAGVNEAIVNELEVMYSLGYIAHAIPFINQPVIKDYVALKTSSRDVVGSLSFSEEMEALVASYIDLAGMDVDTVRDAAKAYFNAQRQQGEDEVEEMTDEELTYRHLLAYLAEQYSVPLTVPQLREDAVRSEDERDAAYYRNQLWVLELMLRMGKVGQANFEIQQGVNIDSKGLKDTTLVGADQQLTEFNRVATQDLIVNADQVVNQTQNIFTFMAAKRNGLDPVRDIFQYGKGTTMFEELKSTFRTLRDVTVSFHKFGDNTGSRKGINTAIVQFMLSDPALYSEMIEDFMERVPASAAEVREFLMKEKYTEIEQGDGTRLLDLEDNAATTLATLLDKISREKAPGVNGLDDTAYTALYDILTTVRPIVQKSNVSPSVALYANANNYKQRLDILLPQSIVRMMRDQNPEVRKVAKMLMVYPYMVGGTNNPTSFLTHVPQEVLFQYGFGSRVRAKMKDLNERFDSLRSELEAAERSAEWKADKRLKGLKVLSGDYVHRQANQSTLNMVRGFVYQYYQHEPYSLRKSFEVKEGTIQDDSDPMHITVTDGYNLPFLVELGATRDKSFFYINNGDGTYRMTDLLGYSFNVNEYSYTTQAREGNTINGRLSVSYDPTVVAKAPVKRKHVTKLPYLVGGEDTQVIKGYRDTMQNVIDWVVDDSTKLLDNEDLPDAAAEINEHLIGLGQYLRRFIPESIPVELGAHQVNIDGKTYNVKGFTFTNDEGAPVRVIYDRERRNKQMEREGADFKFTMMHEATHVAAGRAGVLIENVLAGKLSREAAAGALGVSVEQFGDMMQAWNAMEKMIKDQNFRDYEIGNKKVKYSFARELAQQIHIQLMREATMNEMITSDTSAQMEARAKKMADYATSSVHEFMAAVFGDHRVRQALNEMQVKERSAKTNKSVWQQFLELLQELLGIKEGSALEESLYQTMRVLDPLEKASPTKLMLGVQDRQTQPYTWAMSSPNPYYVDSKGDKRFSAFNAKIKKGTWIWTGEQGVTLPKNMSIEEAWQTLIKGYKTISDGKGKPPKRSMSAEESYGLYRSLWQTWAGQNQEALADLAQKAAGKTLVDRFAKTENNQAKALSDILNEEMAVVAGQAIERGQALPDFGDRRIYYYDREVFTPDLVETLPFAIDLQDVSDRFNFKQISC